MATAIKAPMVSSCENEQTKNTLAVDTKPPLAPVSSNTDKPKTSLTVAQVHPSVNQPPATSVDNPRIRPINIQLLKRSSASSIYKTPTSVVLPILKAPLPNQPPTSIVRPVQHSLLNQPPTSMMGSVKQPLHNQPPTYMAGTVNRPFLNEPPTSSVCQPPISMTGAVKQPLQTEPPTPMEGTEEQRTASSVSQPPTPMVDTVKQPLVKQATKSTVATVKQPSVSSAHQPLTSMVGTEKQPLTSSVYLTSTSTIHSVQQPFPNQATGSSIAHQPLIPSQFDIRPTFSIEHHPQPTSGYQPPTSTVNLQPTYSMGYEPLTSSMAYQPPMYEMKHQLQQTTLIYQSSGASMVDHQQYASSMVYQQPSSTMEYQPATSSLVYQPPPYQTQSSSMVYQQPSSSVEYQPQSSLMVYQSPTSTVYQPTSCSMLYQTPSLMPYQPPSSSVVYQPPPSMPYQPTSSLVYQPPPSMPYQPTSSSVAYQPLSTSIVNQPPLSLPYQPPPSSVEYQPPILPIIDQTPMPPSALPPSNPQKSLLKSSKIHEPRPISAELAQRPTETLGRGNSNENLQKDPNKTKKVNSWASNYLQSIGHNNTKPIKINTSLSQNKMSQRVKSNSTNECKESNKTSVKSMPVNEKTTSTNRKAKISTSEPHLDPREMHNKKANHHGNDKITSNPVKPDVTLKNKYLIDITEKTPANVTRGAKAYGEMRYNQFPLKREYDMFDSISRKPTISTSKQHVDPREMHNKKTDLPGNEIITCNSVKPDATLKTKQSNHRNTEKTPTNVASRSKAYGENRYNQLPLKREVDIFDAIKSHIKHKSVIEQDSPGMKPCNNKDTYKDVKQEIDMFDGIKSNMKHNKSVVEHKPAAMKLCNNKNMSCKDFPRVKHELKAPPSQSKKRSSEKCSVVKKNPAGHVQKHKSSTKTDKKLKKFVELNKQLDKEAMKELKNRTSAISIISKSSKTGKFGKVEEKKLEKEMKEYNRYNDNNLHIDIKKDKSLPKRIVDQTVKPLQTVNSPEKNKLKRKRSGSDKLLDSKTQFSSPIRSVVKLAHSSPPTPTNETCQDETFDLRSKLSRVNRRIYNKTRMENDKTLSKIPKLQEDLKITVDNDLENHKSPKRSGILKYETNSQKCKKIKLIINVVCHESENEKNSSDSSYSESENNPSHNMDLSFLDDFNVDEIVDSLKHSPKRKNNSPQPQIKQNESDHKISSESEQKISRILNILNAKSETNPDKSDCKKPIAQTVQHNSSATTNLNSHEKKWNVKDEDKNVTKIFSAGNSNFAIESESDKIISMVSLDKFELNKAKIQVTGPRVNAIFERKSERVEKNSGATINKLGAMEQNDSEDNIVIIDDHGNVTYDLTGMKYAMESKKIMQEEVLAVQQKNTEYPVKARDENDDFKKTTYVSWSDPLPHNEPINNNNNESVCIIPNMNVNPGTTITIKTEDMVIDLTDDADEDKSKLSHPSIKNSSIEQKSFDEEQKPLLAQVSNPDKNKLCDKYEENNNTTNRNTVIMNNKKDVDTKTNVKIDEVKSQGVKHTINVQFTPVGVTGTQSQNSSKEINQESSDTKIVAVEEKVKINKEQSTEKGDGNETTSTVSMNNATNPNSIAKESESKAVKETVEIDMTKKNLPENTKPKKVNRECNLTGQDNTFAALLETRMLEYLHRPLKVIKLIRKGLHSNIFRCKEPSGQTYAAKVFLDAKNCSGLQKEIMLRQLQKDIPQQNINTVYLIDGFRIERSWCILTEYYPQNLHTALTKRNKPFHITQVQILAKQLISAVLVLRNNNVVHSDIKPSHILLNTTNDRLKLCGFDKAYYIDTVKALPNIGTANYRAPEVILGISAGYSIDVWSTAFVLYQMTTKKKIFFAGYNNDILYNQMCMFGYLPNDMIKASFYRDNHFLGNYFIRQLGSTRKQTMLLRPSSIQFRETNKLQKSLMAVYNNYWWTEDVCQRDTDLFKLNSLITLLKQMFLLDPTQRIPIEFVCVHPFVYNS